MATAEELQEVVNRYVQLVAAHQPERVAELFAQNATIEDPVGTELRASRQSIVDFYAVIASMEHTATELLWSKVAGDTAVFEFKLTVKTAGHGYEVSPIDIMVFDENAKILTMRAVWDPATDITAL